MIDRRRRGGSPVLVVMMVAAVLAVIVAVAVTMRKTAPPAGTNDRATNSKVDPTAAWTGFTHRQWRLSVRIPPGMTVCDLGASGFTLRTNDCGQASAAAFTFRRNDAWSGIDPTAAFNDAYGQELREAGLPTIAGHGIKGAGSGTTTVRKSFGSGLTGALIAEANGNRRVAVDIRLESSTLIEGVPLTADELTEIVLQHVSFTTTATKSK